jgi:hypothetical protein
MKALDFRPRVFDRLNAFPDALLGSDDQNTLRSSGGDPVTLN